MALEDFEAFCGDALTLDDGRPFALEDFQRTMLGGYFDGVRETLAILPKSNGKTTLLAALALFEVCTVPDAEVVIAAASRDQASIMLRQVHGFVRRSEPLQARLAVRQREVEHRELGGRVKVLAADVETADGQIPTLALVDEQHRAKTDELYAVLRDGLGKRGGRMVTISTAGWNRDSALWRARQAALESGASRDGAYMRAGTSSFVLHEWSLSPGADLDDLELVKQANPLSTVTIEQLRERHDSPTMTRAHWARFACCVWTDAEEAWVDPEVWSALADPDVEIPQAAAVYLGVDIGRKHDSSAVVAVHPRADGRLVVKSRVFDPPAGGGALDVGDVEQAIRGCARYWRVMACGYDPTAFVRSAELLGEEINMIEFPQSPTRMAEAASNMLDVVMSGRLAHDGDPVLSRHVLAGIPVETDRGRKISKRKSRAKIDALIALAIAVDLEHRGVEPPRRRSRVPVSF